MVMSKQRDAHDGARETVVVVGMGSTGLSCARYLMARQRRRVILMDTRELPPTIAQVRNEFGDLEQHFGGLDARVLAGAAQVVLSPGLSVHEAAIAGAAAAGVEVIGDIELFARQANAPVLAVTGSNGKSTVTAMLAEMLRAHGLAVRAGGNLGPPALELLTVSGVDTYVLELSSFQLETTQRLDCAAVAVLNLSPDHMDRYRCYADYVAAKTRIYRHAQTLVVNQDDPGVLALETGGRRVLGFSLEPDRQALATVTRAGAGSEAWLSLAGERVLAVAELTVAGRHNQANALAAMALAHCMGVTAPAMAKALREFRGLAHRCQSVCEHGAVRWINDSKGTNVDATIAAIRGLQNGRNIVLIAGGDAKQQDFSSLAEVISRHVHALVLFGRDAGRIEQALAPDQPRVFAGDLDQAVALAAGLARPGMRVLFSPACASFDMFRNYQERGAAFIDAVHCRYPA